MVREHEKDMETKSQLEAEKESPVKRRREDDDSDDDDEEEEEKKPAEDYMLEVINVNDDKPYYPTDADFKMKAILWSGDNGMSIGFTGSSDESLENFCEYADQLIAMIEKAKEKKIRESKERLQKILSSDVDYQFMKRSNLL